MDTHTPCLSVSTSTDIWPNGHGHNTSVITMGASIHGWLYISYCMQCCHSVGNNIMMAVLWTSLIQRLHLLNMVAIVCLPIYNSRLMYGVLSSILLYLIHVLLLVKLLWTKLVWAISNSNWIATDGFGCRNTLCNISRGSYCYTQLPTIALLMLL